MAERDFCPEHFLILVCTLTANGCDTDFFECVTGGSANTQSWNSDLLRVDYPIGQPSLLRTGLPTNAWINLLDLRLPRDHKHMITRVAAFNRVVSL